ncbi:MAG: Calx-beta domain-containing protein [Luteolibacter sp.]
MLKKGAELAIAHTQWIAAMIRVDPRQAIASAVPMVVRQDLPPSIVSLLETRVSTTASLNVSGNVPLPGTEASPDFNPYTRSVTKVDGSYWNAYVYGARASQRTMSVASINGISVGNDMAVAEAPARQLEAGERPSAADREVVEICPVSKKETVVERTTAGELPAITEETPALETEERIIFVCSDGHISQVLQNLAEEEERAHWESMGVYLNAGAGTAAPAAPIGSIPGTTTTGHRRFLYIRATFPDHRIDPQSDVECHDTLRQMADYISQTSYGRCYFTYAVAPLVALPYPESWYLAAGLGGDTLLQDHARTIAKSMGYDYLAYDLDAVRWNGGPGSYGGSAFVGGRGMRMKTNSVGTFCHELGHNLGIWHANYWLTTPPSSIGPGKNAEYGNFFDVMGSETLGQFTAHFKNVLGWLPNETHWTVTHSGTYRIHQFDYASVDPSFRYALRIKKDAEREYWAEFRQLLTNNTGFTNGLMMTWDGWGLNGVGHSGFSPVNGSNKGAQLLDMTPGSFGNGITDTRNDSALWIGRTFSDIDTGIHVTPIAKNSTTPPSMDVYVSVGAVPGNLPPTLAINASNTTPATGGSITLTATATDPNADPLAYSWVFNDGTYSTNSSPSQTKSWTTAGHYQVLCTASDMKGGRTTRSILVTVGTPTTFTVRGNVKGPDSLPLEGVYVANYAPSNATSHPNSDTFRGTWTDSDGNYTLTGLTTGSYTISPNLYPNVFTSSGFTNPVTVGPNSIGRNFISSLLPALTIDVTDPTANEGPTPDTGKIRLERAGSTASALAVQIFNTNTGTATRNVDYMLFPAPTLATSAEGGSGTSEYTIPAGAAFLDITVTPTNDSTTEGTEYAALNFANTSGGYILAGSAVALVDIIDDESPNLPVVKLTYVDNVASEDSPDPAILKIERNGATTNSLTVNLTLTGTAANVTDYTLPASVVIPAGSVNTTFTLTPVDDSVLEETETAIVTIAANVAYARDTLSNAQTITIDDNDQPTVTLVATDPTATEAAGNSGIFTIMRTGGNPYQAITVDYALAGRAVHGVDYRRLDGRAIIPAGASSTTVEIQPYDDTVAEGTQDVILQLRSTTAYRIGDASIATLSITDNENPQFYLKLTTSGVSEPATGSATAIAYQIIRPASGAAVTVNYSLSGTATHGVDFTTLPGTIAFATSDTTKTINVSALADTQLENAETVTMTLLPGTGYTLMANLDLSATGFILDGDQPTVDVSAANTSTLNTQGTETTASIRFFVSRKVSTTSDLIVNYTMGGTATEGVDYTGTTGSVTILSGATSAFVTIVPVNDTIPEGVESIVMNITPASGTYGLRISSATILLGDNDSFGSGSAGFASASSTTTESVGTHIIPVNISGTPVGTVSVSYRVSASTANGAGYDFTIPEGVLTFPPGTTSLNIPVIIHQDLFPEPAETIAIQLYNPTGGNLGTATHTVTITNQSLPEAFTDATTNLLANSVTLNGRALPNGLATNVWFQYGPTSAYGTTTALQAIGSGTASVNVTASLSGFVPAGYHFRSVAENSAGTTYGINQMVSSNNADLTNLTSSVALSPSFSTATLDYTASVSNATSSITVTPTRAQANATVSVNGAPVNSGEPSTAIPLTVGVTPITILVTAQDGNTTKTYTLNVTRNALSFAQWQTSFFGASGDPNAAPDSDPDFDGIVNTLEYVLGGIPVGASASDPSILPMCSMTDAAMIFSFRRTKSSSQQFFTMIEATSTFAEVDWTPVASENVEVEVIDTLTELVTATIPRVLGTDRLLVRLKVKSKP